MSATRKHQLEQEFVRLGLSDADVPDRVSLAEQAFQGFESQFGVEPAWAWWVPGRIEVFGKHTDYAGGRSLVAAVPRGFVIVAGPRDDRLVSAVDAKWQTSVEIDLDREEQSFAGWTNYVAVVARRLHRNFPGAALGTSLAFAGDLPRSAGVSSSSALVVAIASALAERGQLRQRPEWIAAIQTPLDLAGYLGAVENGLTFSSLESISGVGTHGGSEDHTAILTCQPDRVSAYSYVPVRSVGSAALPPAWRFAVLSSGVEAAKAGGARTRYNRASLATRALVDAWQRHTMDRTTPAPTLASILSRAEHAGELRQAIRRHRHPDFDAESLDRRLTHFIAEDARVPLALSAFTGADEDAIGALATDTQHDAEMLLGNQVPETSALAALARESGAFASSSFGAGFGGSVWALVSDRDAVAFLTRWRDKYLDQFPAARNTTGFIARPAPATGRIWP